jgi:hypothetical protein
MIAAAQPPGTQWARESRLVVRVPLWLWTSTAHDEKSKPDFKLRGGSIWDRHRTNTERTPDNRQVVLRKSRLAVGSASGSWQRSPSRQGRRPARGQEETPAARPIAVRTLPETVRPVRSEPPGRAGVPQLLDAWLPRRPRPLDRELVGGQDWRNVVTLAVCGGIARGSSDRSPGATGPCKSSVAWASPPNTRFTCSGRPSRALSGPVPRGRPRSSASWRTSEIPKLDGGMNHDPPITAPRARRPVTIRSLAAVLAIEYGNIAGIKAWPFDRFRAAIAVPPGLFGRQVNRPAES